MNKFVLTLTLILVIAAFAGDSVIESFTVSADGDKAILQWSSNIEGNLSKYKIERSEDGNIFTFIHQVLPEGNFSEYEYIDDDLMKNTSHRVYYYRIKMIFSDGTFAYSETKSVTLNFSGFQETWGSIKAMFR